VRFLKLLNQIQKFNPKEETIQILMSILCLSLAKKKIKIIIDNNLYQIPLIMKRVNLNSQVLIVIIEKITLRKKHLFI
jgi:hypothetical protein